MGIDLSKALQLRVGTVALGFALAVLATSPAAAGSFGTHDIEDTGDSSEFTIVAYFSDHATSPVQVYWCRAKDSAQHGSYWKAGDTHTKPDCASGSSMKTKLLGRGGVVQTTVNRPDGWNKVVVGSVYTGGGWFHHARKHDSRSVLNLPSSQ